MECYQYFVRYFSQLFLVICPLAIVAMFISMTAPFTPAERVSTAKTGSAVAYGTMLFFALTGRKLFELLGITIGSFYIAGGVIIFLVGITMLQTDDIDIDDGQTSGVNKKHHADISITPFAIPIICGPVGITSVITLQSQADGLLQHIAGLAALTAVFALLYLFLLLSAYGEKWLSPVVLKLSFKLSGLILAALAVQMMISGLRHGDIKILKPLPKSVSVKSKL